MMFITPLIDYFRANIALWLLIALVLASSVGVIYAKHIGRTQFIVLQKLEAQRDRLDEEWGRLLLEQSTWASPNRIEQQAARRLSMVVPTTEMTLVVKP